MLLNTLHTARKIFYLLTFTYLLNLLTCSTAKNHETSIEDSGAGFLISFSIWSSMCIAIWPEKCTPNALMPNCPTQVQKSGGHKICFAREFAPHFQTPGAALACDSMGIWSLGLKRALV